MSKGLSVLILGWGVLAVLLGVGCASDSENLEEVVEGRDVSDHVPEEPEDGLKPDKGPENKKEDDEEKEKTCTKDLECEAGEFCVWQKTTLEAGTLVGGQQVSEPKKYCKSIQGLPDSIPCSKDQDCEGGTCLKEEEGWRSGYCTTVQCGHDHDCASHGLGALGAICHEAPHRTGISGKACFRECQENLDCRPGYVCEKVQGKGICVPKAPLTLPDYGEDLQRRDAQCLLLKAGEEAEVHYDLPQGIESFHVNTWTIQGSRMEIYEMENAQGAVLDLKNEQQETLSYMQRLFPAHISMAFPLAPRWRSFLKPGRMTFRIRGWNDDVYCMKLYQKMAQGDGFDLNIYLVGVKTKDQSRDLTAQEAALDPDLQKMLQTVKDRYALQNLKIHKVRYYDVDPEVKAMHRVITGQEEFAQLVAHSKVQGTSARDLMAINLFLVEAIVVQGTVGFSQGIPLAAGLHGTPTSGLVFTTSELRSPYDSKLKMTGATFTGAILAHELGHALGLFHTTEVGGRHQDPLVDTPYCESGLFGRNPKECPDVENMMFPYAYPMSTKITEDQAQVMRWSVLAHE